MSSNRFSAGGKGEGSGSVALHMMGQTMFVWRSIATKTATTQKS